MKNNYKGYKIRDYGKSGYFIFKGKSEHSVEGAGNLKIAKKKIDAIVKKRYCSPLLKFSDFARRCKRK